VALTIDLLAGGILLGGALLIERGRYHRKPGGGTWEPTGERFIDPTSGHLIEVRYNAQSGERQYQDLGSAEKENV